MKQNKKPITAEVTQEEDLKAVKTASPENAIGTMREVWCNSENKSYGTFPKSKAEEIKEKHLNRYPGHDVILIGRQ